MEVEEENIIQLSNGNRHAIVENPTVDHSIVLANRLVRHVKRKLVKKREVPIDEYVLNKTLAHIHQLALRILRTRKQQVRPNTSELHAIGYEDRHINEKIVLGFSKAQARDPSCEAKSTTFVSFLNDPELTNASRNGLLTALQNFANHMYTKYRLFLFSEENHRVPEYRGKRTPEHRVPLCIYVDKENAVFVVTNVARLFNANNVIFCPDCATTYSKNNPEKHKKTCPMRCPNCCSYGYEFPCADQKMDLLCNDCNRIFNNTDCYLRHKGNVCNTVKCCENCSDTYVIVDATEHKCRHRHCHYCRRYHQRNAKCTI